jgi:multiple sugar transport system permease protein
MSAMQPSLSLFGGRRGRHLREYLTAYAMIAPAILLIFVFGIFPVGFALYVSLHKWVLVRSDFVGLQNYIAALDSLTYVVLFGLAVLALVVAIRSARGLAAEAPGRAAWLLAIPGLLHAAAVTAFFRWLFFQLPEFLDIASKMRGQERTRELFLGLLGEAFRAENVYPYWQQFMLILFVALVVGVLAGVMLRVNDNANFQARFAVLWLALGAGVGLLATTYRAVGEAYAAAFESNTDPGIWPQFILIGSGVGLLWLAWRLWRSAEGQVSGRAFALRLFGALGLMVGAVLLITEIPTILASGVADMWNGLKVTVFFALGTVPIQLGIALLLAVLLFQRLRGSDVFRVLYFLPYVTPAVASATIFKLLFSDRATAPINRIIAGLGIEPQLWLRESDGVLSLLASSVGIKNFPAAFLPAWLPADLSALAANWLTGPSQALVVILALSVWTFVGYNTVIYLAGLGNIAQELTEAAEIDGASKWGVFRHVTFPLLSPTTYFLSLVGVMGTFKAFNTIWVLRNGQALGTTDTFSVVIFQEFFEKSRYGYASALAFILFGIILLLTFANSKIQGSRVFYG